MRMRAPDNECLIETFHAYGAAVTALPYSEIRSRLAEGIIDGQFNPMTNIFDLHIDEVQDYLTITNSTFYVAFMIMNKDVFDRLDADLQRMLLEAGRSGRDAARRILGEQEEGLLRQAKTAFKEVSCPDSRPFEAAVQPVYAKMAEVMGAEIIDSTRQFLQEYRKTVHSPI